MTSRKYLPSFYHALLICIIIDALFLVVFFTGHMPIWEFATGLFVSIPFQLFFLLYLSTDRNQNNVNVPKDNIERKSNKEDDSFMVIGWPVSLAFFILAIICLFIFFSLTDEPDSKLDIMTSVLGISCTITIMFFIILALLGFTNVVSVSEKGVIWNNIILKSANLMTKDVWKVEHFWKFSTIRYSGGTAKIFIWRDKDFKIVLDRYSSSFRNFAAKISSASKLKSETYRAISPLFLIMFPLTILSCWAFLSWLSLSWLSQWTILFVPEYGLGLVIYGGIFIILTSSSIYLCSYKVSRNAECISWKNKLTNACVYVMKKDVLSIDSWPNFLIINHIYGSAMFIVIRREKEDAALNCISNRGSRDEIKSA